MGVSMRIMQTIKKTVFASGIALLVATSGMSATLGDMTPKELEAEVHALSKEYIAKLQAGSHDKDLAKLVRDVSEALRNENYDKVRELLSTRLESGAVTREDGKSFIKEITGLKKKPPVTVANGVATERIKIETMPGFNVEVLVLKPVIAEEKETAQDKKIKEIITGKKDSEPVKKKPKTIKKFPAIFLSHGGTNGIPSGYLMLARRLAMEGYLVYAPYFRGQGNSDGEFEYATGELVDFFVIFNAMKKRADIEPKRIALVGGGHGGLLTLIALASMEDIACAAVISAPTDLESLVLRERAFRMQFDKNPGLLNARDIKALRARSPIYLAGQITAPLMMLHGGADKYIPSKYAKGFASVMKSLDKDNLTLRIYKSADHRLFAKYLLYDDELQEFLGKKLKPAGSKTTKKSTKPTQKPTKKKPSTQK